MDYKVDLQSLVHDNLPEFANDVLKYYKPLKNKDFISNEPEVLESVNLGLVVGSQHCNYSGNSWENIIQNGKRSSCNLAKLKTNPNYYLSREEKEHFSFVCLDGEYYITEGNHRTAIAKFFFHYNSLPPVIHGVKVTHRTTDFDALVAFKRSRSFQTKFNKSLSYTRPQSFMYMDIGKPEEYLGRNKGFVRFSNGTKNCVLEEEKFELFFETFLKTSLFKQLVFPLFDKNSYHQYFLYVR